MLRKKSKGFGEGRFRFRRTREAYRSRWFWYVSYGFLFLLVAVFSVVTLVPSDPATNGPAKAVAAAQSAATAAPGTSSGPSPEVSFTGCKAQKAPPLDPEFRAPAPVTSTWTPGPPGGMAVPSSRSGGPLVGRVCFTRTPEGALYSAANFVAEFLALDPDGRTALMSQRYANPGGAQVAQRGLPKLLNDSAGTSVPDAARVFTGYRWETWTPDLAIVSIAFRWISGQMTGAVYLATYTLTWSDNDWKLVSPGKNGVPVQYVTGESASAAQYTPWGP